MKKVKMEEKPKKYKTKYTILINRSKKLKKNQLKFISKPYNKYQYLSIISLKLIYIILLLLIYKLEKKQKFIKKINSFISKYILKNAYKNIKACLCVIGKNENLYAKEYVTYYKDLGYNHIYIYDNNDHRGERFEEVLKEEIDSNFVTIINYRGKSPVHITRGPQCLAFRHCYDSHRREYDWLSFFDFDEFLEVRPKAKNIQEFLGNQRYEKCDNIKINFLIYGDNELLYYDNRPVQERFSVPNYKQPNNVVIKSTVRGGLPHNYWRFQCHVHTSNMNVTNCNAQGEIISYYTGVNKPANYTYAALKHYYTKSVEEYVNKSRRGDSYIVIGYNEAQKRKRIKKYFEYNNYSVEKENLFKKLFHLE